MGTEHPQSLADLDFGAIIAGLEPLLIGTKNVSEEVRKSLQREYAFNGERLRISLFHQPGLAPFIRGTFVGSIEFSTEGEYMITEATQCPSVMSSRNPAPGHDFRPASRFVTGLDWHIQSEKRWISTLEQKVGLEKIAEICAEFGLNKIEQRWLCDYLILDDMKEPDTKLKSIGVLEATFGDRHKLLAQIEEKLFQLANLVSS